MAKIWRRKKGGREVGSFHVLCEGKPVNLKTKDAREANRRARLALRGEWPDDSAARAADVAKLAEHVPEYPAEKAEVADAPSPMGNTATVPQPAGFAESPPPAAAPLPPAESEPVSAAAAAAEVAGGPAPVAGGLAEDMGQALRAEFFPEGQGEGDLGAMAAALALGIEYEIGAAIARKQKPPRAIPEPTKEDVIFRVLKCACGVLGRRWSGNIDVDPWWVVGIALLAYPVQMAVTARPIAPPDGEPPKPETN